MGVGQGKGYAIQFHSGFFGKVRSIRHSGKGREVVDLSAIDDDWDANEPHKRLKAGQLAISMLYDASLQPPFDADPEAVSLIPPTAGAKTISGTAYIIEASEAIEHGPSAMMQDITLQFTGALAYT